MERAVELEWREIIAHLDDAPAPPDDNAFAHWSIALGAMGLLPMLAPETWPAAVPLAVIALLLGVIGLRRAAAVGRGRTRSAVGIMLAILPIAALGTVAVLTAVIAGT